MQDIVNCLLDSYTKYRYGLCEYKVVTDKLKEFTKAHNNKTIVDYYSLQLKLIDKSTYSSKLIPYLKENNLDKFIEEKVNNKKIYDLIKSGALNEEFVIDNIESEKSILDIKMANFKNEIALFEKNLIKEVEQMEIIKCVRKRETLRYQIDQCRYNYYNCAKQVKYLLLGSEVPQYRFQYGDDIGVLKIKNINRVYTKSFLDSLRINNPDVLCYSVNSPALLKSKSKKINRNTINEFKIDDYKEYLYIKILTNLFNKKNRKLI